MVARLKSVSGKRGSGEAHVVKFGNVTVEGESPPTSVVKSNVERSSEVLKHVVMSLSKPGVTFRDKKDVPRYWASEDEPGVFVRRLNKQTQRGRLIGGKFEVIE